MKVRKVYGECTDCGGYLYHHSATRCPECNIQVHPGSSQCPYCMEWYYTHSGNVKKDELKYHALKQCL